MWRLYNPLRQELLIIYSENEKIKTDKYKSNSNTKLKLILVCQLLKAELVLSTYNWEFMGHINPHLNAGLDHREDRSHITEYRVLGVVNQWQLCISLPSNIKMKGIWCYRTLYGKVGNAWWMAKTIACKCLKLWLSMYVEIPVAFLKFRTISSQNLSSPLSENWQLKKMLLR